MKRQLGILVLAAILIGCGGDEEDLTADEGEAIGERDGGGQSDPSSATDGGFVRHAATPADATARADASTARDAGAGGGSTRDAATPPSTSTSTSSTKVETVVTISTSVLGVDGILTTYPQGVVLFKDGSGCYDIDALHPTTDLARHRAQAPKDWFKWQRGPDGKFQRLDPASGAWKSLGAEATYPPLARGAALNGTFAHAGAGGTTAWGSKVSSFQFSRDLTFSVVGGTARGTYAIDGYTLTLKDASGRSEAHSIYGSGRGYWIDGANYIAK